ncbi:MAG: hypothetical protein HYU66_14345 [Armatimonadetes bacterium]|nr:hypothetical protein [Armatimonadota bacterium]
MEPPQADGQRGGLLLDALEHARGVGDVHRGLIGRRLRGGEASEDEGLLFRIASDSA